jgi:hypothetical protein
MICLRFCTWHSASSKLITLFEDGFWATHVETVMPDGRWLGARFKGGVLARPANYDHDKVSKQVFVEIPCTEHQAELYYEFMERQLNKPYDVTGIIGILFQRNWRERAAWFCSELVVAGLCYCGILPEHIAIILNHVTPRDAMLIVSCLLK